MVQLDYLSLTLEDTTRLAERIARGFNRPLILALTGQLGSGKTAFVQVLANSLGLNKVIQSPTFTLINEYKLPDGWLIHGDLYRIDDINDIQKLGLQDYFSEPNTISAIEWADHAPQLFPPETVWIDFTLSPNHRVIQIAKKQNEPISRFLVMGEI